MSNKRTCPTCASCGEIEFEYPDYYTGECVLGRDICPVCDGKGEIGVEPIEENDLPLEIRGSAVRGRRDDDATDAPEC
jgi:hypothetical protein